MLFPSNLPWVRHKENNKARRRHDEACCLQDVVFNYSFTLLPTSLPRLHEVLRGEFQLTLGLTLLFLCKE